MAGLASLYPVRDDLPLVREDGPPVARGLGVSGLRAPGKTPRGNLIAFC